MDWLFQPETLNAVLTVSIAIVALASVYALIYMGLVFQKVNKVLTTYRGIIKRVEDTLDFIKNKMDNSAMYLGHLTDGVKDLAAMFGVTKKKRK